MCTAQQDTTKQNNSQILAPSEKINVGIMPFENLNDEYDWLGFGLEYLLSEKLTKISTLYIPNKILILEALKKRNITTNKIDGDIIYQVGRETGIDIAISGDYITNGKYLQLNIRFVNSFTGTTISTKNYTNKLNNIFDISSDIVTNLINLTLITVSTEETTFLNRKMTNSVDAFENFCLGYLENEKPDSKMAEITGFFQKAIELDNNFWEAHFNLGITYYNDRKYNEALKEFDIIINKLPDFEKAYYGRGLIYFHRNDSENAKIDFTKVVELNPNDYMGYFYLGKISLFLNQFTESKKYLEKVRKINPDYAEGHYEMGNVWFNQKLFYQAITHYRKCIELNPKHMDARQRLGESYFRTQAYYRALLEFEAILTLNPYDANAYFMIGSTVYKQAVLNDLIKYIFEFINPYETKKIEEKELASTEKLRQDLYKKMADSFYKAQELKENFLQASFNLALTYKEMKEYDLSIEFFQKTIAISPTLIKAHIQMAQTYEQMGEKQKALQKYKDVIEIDPSYFVAHPTLSVTHQYINIIDVFMDELEEKIQDDPNDLKANQTMGKIFYAQGHHGKAANIFRKILNNYPNDNTAKEMLQKIEKI